MALLAAPVVLWLLGDRQPLLQNTPKQPFPTLNRRSITGPGTFRALDGALLDRFPLRDLALDVRGTIEVDVYHQSPNPDVGVGADGRLDYRPELGPCTAKGRPLSDPADAMDLMARTLVAAGYRTSVMIADAKQYVDPRGAASFDQGIERCVAAMERRIDDRLAHTPGGIAINAPLRAMARSGISPFLKTDTHWDWRGRELFAREVLDGIRPGLAEQTGVHAGAPIAWRGNLTMLMGLERTEPDRAVIASRPPSPPLPPGQVVLIGDSQLGVSLVAGLEPGKPSIHDLVLPNEPICTWDQFIAGGCDDMIRGARTIVFEKVSRDLLSVTTFCWRPIALAGERLRTGPPGRWIPLDAKGQADSVLTIPTGGSATARIQPPSGDVSASPRLLRLPILHQVADQNGAATPVTMVQQPRSGPPAPCATPSQTGVGAALFLPVPAHRRASDLAVRLISVPGTKLGPPEEISLAGR